MINLHLPFLERLYHIPLVASMRCVVSSVVYLVRCENMIISIMTSRITHCVGVAVDADNCLVYCPTNVCVHVQFVIRSLSGIAFDCCTLITVALRRKSLVLAGSLSLASVC